jgi:sugar-specific transcriptional regulator TrmB
MLRLDEAVQRVRRQLSLDESEASLYVRLCVGGPAKVSDLSDVLGLHRNEVYRMAERLVSRGLVVTTDERPARMQAVPPEAAFDAALTARLARVEALKRSRQEIATLVAQLDARTGNASAKSTYKLLRGRPEIYRERQFLLESAAATLDWASTLPEAVRLADESGQLALLAKRAADGVRVRILVAETPDARARLAPLVATKGVEVRWLDQHGLVRFTLVDDHELLMFVVNAASTSLQAEDEVAIHTTAAGFAHAQRVFFDAAWASSRAFSPEGAKP